MVRKLKTVVVDKHKTKDFIAVAKNFFNGAEVAAEYEYWNAAGVLIVHSAIAYSDAITVKYGKAKSKSDDHQDVINLNPKRHTDIMEVSGKICKLGR